MLLQITEPQEKQSQDTSSMAIGIDLGTTNSVVAFSKNQNPQPLLNEEGAFLIPSVVAYLENASPLVGEKAVDLIDEMPENIISSSKRFMGKSTQETQELAGQSVITEGNVSANQDTMVRLKVGNHIKTPLEVAADILRTLKKQAEFSLQEDVHQAVITVPAYFDEAARQATKEAAHLAGLKVLRLINEPTAAALAYGLEQNVEGIYAIYDLGGGTFDISLLRLTKGVFQVLATGGDRALGGDDIDTVMVEYYRHLSSEVSLTPAAYKKALKVMREAKEYLSHHECGLWSLPGAEEHPLDRLMLEQLAMPFVEKTVHICRQVLLDASLTPQDIQGVVLVGGSTRMPLVRQRVGEFFGQDPLTNLDPDTVVALGAALQAEGLTKGMQTLLLDVTPLSLGLETMGGLVEKIIPRNTPIPAAMAQEFTTYQDGQTAMKIHVLQGERELVAHCRSLGEFTLTGIPSMVAGAARIEVTFTIDADGLLTVSAREKSTHVFQEVSVKPSYGLTEEDYHRILRENAHHGSQDVQERLFIEAKLKAEQLLDQLEKAIQADGMLLTEAEKESLPKAIKALEESLTESQQDVIVERRKTLEAMSVPFATRRMQRLVKEVTTVSAQSDE